MTTETDKAIDFINQWDFELRQMEQFNDNEGVIETILHALRNRPEEKINNKEGEKL